MLELCRNPKLATEPHVHIWSNPDHRVVVLDARRVEPVETHAGHTDVIQDFDICLRKRAHAAEASARAYIITPILNATQETEPLNRVTCVERQPVKSVLEEGKVRAVPAEPGGVVKGTWGSSQKEIAWEEMRGVVVVKRDIATVGMQNLVEARKSGPPFSEPRMAL